MENDNSMDLQEFVKETLVEVIKGAHKAAEEISGQHTEKNLLGGINVSLDPSLVEFDVAVTVSRGTKGGGRLGVSIFGVEATVSGSTQSQHRIKFSIPVTFVSQPLEKKYLQANAPATATADTQPGTASGPEGPPQQ